MEASSRLVVCVAAAGIGFYALAGWGIGADVLDSDTLSLVLAWHLLRDGVQVESWQLAVPKALPIILDGGLYELAGPFAVLTRSVLAAVGLLVTTFWLLHKSYSSAAGLLAVGFLLANRTLLISTLGGNATVFFTLALLGAAVAFAEWPPSKSAMVTGLACLTVAALLRQEGLAFLALAGVGLLASNYRPHPKRAVASLLAAGGLLVCVLFIQVWVAGALTVDHLSDVEIARNHAAVMNTVAAATGIERPGLPAEMYRLLAFLLRPWPWYLAVGAVGAAALWRRSAPTAVLLAAMVVTPLAYCVLFGRLDLPLFERFLFPTAVAVHLFSAVGCCRLWDWLQERASRYGLWAARAFVALAVLAAWTVAARDCWYEWQGYLKPEAAARREFSQGLARISSKGTGSEPLLVSGLHYPYAILQTGADINRVHQDGFVLADDPRPERLRRFKYILYDRNAEFLQRLLDPYLSCEAAACRLRIADQSYEAVWTSRGGQFVFFAREGS
jgi:hypothetical protein